MLGAYEVSNLGNVRRATPGRKTYAGRPLKPTRMKIGYLSIATTQNGKVVRTYIHHLVAESFIGPRPSGADINHRDGDKTNNVVSNLEYVTHAENIRHALTTGLIPTGDRHPLTKLSDAQVREIRARREAGHGITSMAREYGVSPGTICWIAKGKRRAG